jgi:sugar/nucleoside kinase (ribokinase family)
MNYYYVIKIEFAVGISIEEAVKDALDLSEKTDKTVEFDFNGKLMNVHRISQFSVEKQIKFYIDIYHSHINNSSEKS